VKQLSYIIQLGVVMDVVDIFRAHGDTMERRRRESVL